MKHLKKIEDLIEARTKAIDLAKELRKSVEYHDCKYILLKVDFGINKFVLMEIANQQTELVSGTPSRIKSYINLRKIDIETIFGKELIFETSSDKYAKYDDFVQKNEESLKLYKELLESTKLESCTHILTTYKEGGLTRFLLLNKEDKKQLCKGTPSIIVKYLKRHRIEEDKVYNIKLLK